MRNRIVLFLYLVFVFFTALYAFKRPYYNWDMLAYMAVVTGYDHSEPGMIHDTVYAIARRQLPAATYNQLIDGGLEFRKRVAEDPAEFYRQMPFYTVKPLYTWLVYLMYKAGAPLVQATILPSFLSYFLIGSLLVFWIRKYLPFMLAIAVSALAMVSAPMWDVVRCSSPDCLSALLLLSAMYFVLEKKSLVGVFVFLLLSILARLDNAIPAVFILSLLAVSNKWETGITLKKYLMMLLAISCACLFISFNARQPGWSIFYYPTFLKSLNLSYSLHPEFHGKDYISLVISHFMTGLFFSNLVLFLILASLTFVGRPNFRFRDMAFDQLFVLVILAILLVRFVLEPVIADRFYIAYYLCILILLIRRLHGQLPGSAVRIGR